MKTTSARAKTSHHNVLMRFALGEPPCSGLKVLASAMPVAARTATRTPSRANAMARRRRVGAARRKARRFYSENGHSGSAERGLALLHERRDALDEVCGARHLLLDVGFELELLAHSRVQPVVQLALGSGVGARRSGGQSLDQLFGC